MADDDVVATEAVAVPEETGAAEALPTPVAEMPVVAATPKPLPTITSAQEWRRKAKGRWLLTLPGGITVKVQRPDYWRLVDQSVVTNEDLVLAGQGGAASRPSLLKLARAVAPYIVLEPRIVVPNGKAVDLDADVISVDDISDGDLVILFLWSGGWSTAELPAVEVD